MTLEYDGMLTELVVEHERTKALKDAAVTAHNAAREKVEARMAFDMAQVGRGIGFTFATKAELYKNRKYVPIEKYWRVTRIVYTGSEFKVNVSRVRIDGEIHGGNQLDQHTVEFILAAKPWRPA